MFRTYFAYANCNGSLSKSHFTSGFLEIKNVKQQLKNLALGLLRRPKRKVPHRFTSFVTLGIWSELNKIGVHSLWAAACLLHPDLRAFPFSRSQTNVNSLREKGKTAIT